MGYYSNDSFIPQSSSSSDGSNSQAGGDYYRQTIDSQLMQSIPLNYSLPTFSDASYQTAYTQPQPQPQLQLQPNPTILPPRQQKPSSSQVSPAYTRTAAYLNDGPPSHVPDAGDYLRRKYNIPVGVDVNLYALPDPPYGAKTSYPLPCLIALSIYGSPRKMLTLKEIYAAIEERFEWHRRHPCEGGWKNSIRHNLSLNLIFRTKDRPITEPGKGCYWYIDISDGEGTKRDRKRGNRRAYARDEDENSVASFDSDISTQFALGHDVDLALLHDRSSSRRSLRHTPGRWSSSPGREIDMRQRSSRLSAQSQPMMQHPQLFPTTTLVQYPYDLSPSYEDAYLASVILGYPHGQQFFSSQ